MNDKAQPKMSGRDVLVKDSALSDQWDSDSSFFY